MHLALLTFTITLPGCRSLKEKRQRVGGLHERLGQKLASSLDGQILKATRELL